MSSGDSQDLDYFTEKMESDDDRIDIILSQVPLLENEEVEVAVFETIMEKEDDEVSHVSEGEMMESVGREEEGGKGSTGHEEKNKKEQRSTEEERREASRGENESAIEIGNVDEEAENGLHARIRNGENGESGPTARTFADVQEGGTRTTG
ncbi:hypothetical protein OUZ56_011718 [Daphnia magna]|uniref:Uncharacterized protein n=1 Tax=Daphnia magna TaxID=35525 RepID=A0ABQ9Z169_9CRUS|nr:hypothetical protein OUZ56_011718 [Daphnia magna]